MSEPLSLTEQLAKHLQRPVDGVTRTRARLHLLDWLACVAGARGSDAYKGYLRMQVQEHIWMGNILEMDDVHRQALLHPGPVVWPNCLKFNGSIDETLDAAVRGYEAMIAIGSTLDAFHYSLWHPTSTCGPFGAAIADMASLGSFEVEDFSTIANALGLAGTATGGLWQTRHESDDAKQFHVLQAVHRGAEASSAALFGASGPRFILEGPQGLYAATCREPKPMTFPDQWRIHDVSFKPWAACRHAHAAIDCALELSAVGKLQPPFLLETYADAITFCDNPEPTTEVEAKFSLQHSVAVIADGRNATPADFTREAIAQLARLRAEVTVTEAPEITARYPAHFGARLNGLELVDTRGDPERPVGEADIITKMHMLAKWGGLPPEEAERAVERALRGNDSGAIVQMLDDWLR